MNAFDVYVYGRQSKVLECLTSDYRPDRCSGCDEERLCRRIVEVLRADKEARQKVWDIELRSRANGKVRQLR